MRAARSLSAGVSGREKVGRPLRRLLERKVVLRVAGREDVRCAGW
jgi:hypothetical protein